MDLSMSRALDSWMASVDPKNFIYTPEVLATRAALFSASGAMETPAMMVVTNSDAVAAQQRDLFQAQKATGPKSKESVQNMLAAPATGLLHVSNMARIATGWSPVLLEDSKANSIAYQEYTRKLSSFPIFTLDMAQHETVTRKSSDWKVLIHAIAGTFKGLEKEDNEAIVTSLENLTQAASSSKSNEQKTSLFCQGVMNAEGGKYELYVYSSACTFIEQQHKGFHSMQSTFDLLKFRMTLHLPLWTEDVVSKIIGQTESSLDDWLKQNQSSLEDTKPIPALTD